MTTSITRLAELLGFKRARPGIPRFARGSAVWRFTLGVLLAGAGLVSATPAGAQTMEGLGFLPGTAYPNMNSSALGVSADGSTVVGSAVNSDGNAEAFVWTAASGTMTGLGFLPGAAYPYSVATGVSADGSTVVGYAASADSPYEAFVWTATSGTMTALGFLSGTHSTHSYANGVSADGSTVIGYSSNADGNAEAFVWTATSGTMTGLGFLPGTAYQSSFAYGVSADGSTVVGFGYNAEEGTEAFVWTATSGTMTGLGFLPGAPNGVSVALGVSADGSTVVGYGHNAEGNVEAVVSTTTPGTMTGLGFFPGAAYLYGGGKVSEAHGVSADGSTVVGYGYNAEGDFEAFAWTPASGMTGLGFFPGTPYEYSYAAGVSADGSTGVGYGYNADGNYEAFVFKLRPVPPTIADLIVDLILQVASLNLKHAIENSLDAKLDSAFDALEAENATSAVSKLNAFINEVNAQRGKKIPTADADALIAAALEIIVLLQ